MVERRFEGVGSDSHVERDREVGMGCELHQGGYSLASVCWGVARVEKQLKRGNLTVGNRSTFEGVDAPGITFPGLPGCESEAEKKIANVGEGKNEGKLK